MRFTFTKKINAYNNVRMINMFIFAFLGTVGFSLIGVIFSIFGSKINPKIIKFLKGFTFGSISALLLVGILKESIESFEKINENFSILISFAIIAVVVGLFYLVHYIFDKKHHDHRDDYDCDSHDFHLHENKSLFATSILFLVSISLHNIPEGLALGSAFIGDELHGILLSLVVFGLHNFVIGYTICDSLIKAKIKKRNAIILTLVSSVAAYGAAIGGYFVGNIDIYFEAIFLCLSAGAMLYIILKELLPDIIKNYDMNVAISLTFGLILTVLILTLHIH